MRLNMGDTPKEISDIYKKMIMSRTPAERMRMASGMFDAASALATAGIRAEGKDLKDIELRQRLFVRFHGKDFTSEEMAKILSRVFLRGS
ncbi:MAG: hypothetical protein AUK25_15050 [Desulfobacteraceae bacterium CG2_30_51_40]|nr:MAG: hypothetical protein AUK25_15050 [Desulfobacteraceae bacterium CG2_30_51_40]